ncbi:hypothetical protein [Oceanibaculum pacificum]|uniref:hypothetical protein n=1 Tax=Oceanibaculum pacificum TaxID=580166 RepID=UPI0012ED9710|nr:hypothetical protein [Oceanibaculum pacificum]
MRKSPFDDLEALRQVFGRIGNRFKEVIERRGFHRLRPRGDAYVRIDRHDYPLSNWTPTGFCIRPYNGALIAGQKVTVDIVIRDIHDRDGEVRFHGMAVVSRIDEKGELAARWWLLDAAQRTLLLSYYEKKQPKP